MPTQRQINTLKYLIGHATLESGTERLGLAKRIILFLIDQSEELTRDVCITLQESPDGYSTKEIHTALEGILSLCNAANLNELLILIGSELQNSYHYGDFDPNREGDKLDASGQLAGTTPGKFASSNLYERGHPHRYTFWLSRQQHSREATFVPVTKKQLEEVNINTRHVH